MPFPEEAELERAMQAFHNRTANPSARKIGMRMFRSVLETVPIVGGAAAIIGSGADMWSQSDDALVAKAYHHTREMFALIRAAPAAPMIAPGFIIKVGQVPKLAIVRTEIRAIWAAAGVKQ